MARTALDERLFEEQRRIRRRIRLRKLGDVVGVSLAVLMSGLMAYVALAAVVLPHWRMRGQQGQHLEQVERELGAPLHRWSKEDFRCVPNYRCKRKAPPEGPVFFYRAAFMGYYLYANEAGVVIEVEANSS